MAVGALVNDAGKTHAVSGTSSTGFELVDNGEGRVLEDVAAWSESFLYREFDGTLTGRLL